MRERPADLITPLALTNFRGQYKRFGIKREDRRAHIYAIGKTGMGKSTLLLNLIHSDLERGEGLAVFDPHGDLIEDVLRILPKRRFNDTLYFHPHESPLGFNMLEHSDRTMRPLIASGVIAVFQKIWPEFWGPRTEHLLRHALLALLEFPGMTLGHVQQMLADEAFQDAIASQVQDQEVRRFWLREYQGYSKYFKSEAIAPIQNKLGAFLANPWIRNIVCRTKSAFNLRQVMDQGKIALFSLSKGQVGEDVSALLGALLLTQVHLAALSRQDQPEGVRRDFYVYVDEFGSLLTPSVADLLTEGRKYRLNLVLAHQHMGQVPENIMKGVLGNAGTIVSFRVGAEDAETLAKEFSPVFTVEDLVSLPKHQIYLRLMIDGVPSRPFSATTLPPPPRHRRPALSSLGYQPVAVSTPPQPAPQNGLPKDRRERQGSLPF